jgi:antitoxin VapB
MGVQMNIKNAAVIALAREVAELKGVSLTEAIHSALQTHLAEIESEDRRARGHAMIRAARADWTDEQRSVDHGELLYDEAGMPR